jgi:Putative beta-barrel porin 2
VLEYDITRQLFFRANFLHLHANESSLSSGNGRLENTYFYKASLGYEITRYWVWYLDYAYERRDANIEANEFDRQIIQSGLIARF